MKKRRGKKKSQREFGLQMSDPPPLKQAEGVLPPLTAQHHKSLSPRKHAKATCLPKPRFCFLVVRAL